MTEKLENGNPGGRRLLVLDIPEIEGADIPKHHDFLNSDQYHNVPSFQASEIYETTWNWLKGIRCASKVSPQLIEQYAVCTARWIQCEELNNRYGFMSMHPTTKNSITSPFINIGINYLNKSTRIWNEIFQIVKENCSTDYGEFASPKRMFSQPPS